MKITLTDEEQTRLQTHASDLIQKAKALGATQVEVAGSVDCGLSTTVRLGNVETVEFNRDQGLGITVYFGKQRGHASSSDLSEEALDKILHAACDIAKASAKDEFAGLADPELMAYDYPDLDLSHPWDIDMKKAIDIAKTCEDHARASDKRITNSEGASVSSYQSLHVYGNSHGFVGVYPTTRHSISCVLVASEKDQMERDYAYTCARDANDMWTVEDVANDASERTLRRLNSRRIKTQEAPVIFHADVASSLLRHFIAAISGSSLYRKTSFLLDHIGQQIFPEFITIDERPHLPKIIGSAPFDGEGVQTKARTIVSDGVLNDYVLGSYSARKLGLQTTGNAGGVHNLFINTSDSDFQTLLKEMDTGLLVTEMMGQGVRITNGDYSRGAAGFWVENGELKYPVSEITIAGNLKDMFLGIKSVGNDVDMRKNIKTGSIFIERMMIAGE